MRLYMFYIIVEDMKGWLSQERGLMVLMWKGSRATVYVLYYCSGREWLAAPGGWGRVYGGRGVMWLFMFCIIAEDMNGWLAEPGGWGRD